MALTIGKEQMIDMICNAGGYSRPAGRAIYEFLHNSMNDVDIEDIDFGEIREYYSVEDAIRKGEDINPDPMAEYAWGERIEEVIELGPHSPTGWASGSIVVITTRWNIGYGNY